MCIRDRHWAHRNHRVRVALSFDYASNHAERELECAAWQAASLGIEHRVIDISPISVSYTHLASLPRSSPTCR